jgi:hypothetical protein
MRPIIFLLTILALVGYLAPWVVHSTSALTLHAYDFAEWTSLHPLMRTESPALFTTALLRIPMVCLCSVLALLAAHKPYRWMRMFVLLIAIGLLPPLEFISQTGNVNYRQQFLWTLVCLGVLGISFMRPIRSSAYVLTLISIGIGVVSGLLGVARGAELMRSFGMPTQFGIGIPLWLTCMAAFTIFLTQELLLLKSEQGSSSTRPTLPC